LKNLFFKRNKTTYFNNIKMENQLVKITHIKDKLKIYGIVDENYFEIIFKVFEEDIPVIENNESQILIKDNNKYYFCGVSVSDKPLVHDDDRPIPINNFNYHDYNIPAYIYCIMIGMVSTNI